MTLSLSAADLAAHLDDAVALKAMEEAFTLEAAGRVRLPARLDVRTDGGFLRVMPAVLDDVMGLKVMTLATGLGTRYLVLLYDVACGELLAVLDADEMTRRRTAATTALAARALAPSPPSAIGLLGSGFEATGQLSALAALWPSLADVAVYSPTPERRQRFADEMGQALGIDVHPVHNAAAAVAGQSVLVLATKSTNPVLDGALLQPGCLVLSIGSTRPDLRELDRVTLARARLLVGDSPEELVRESGDIADAVSAGVVEPQSIVALAAVLGGATPPSADGQRDLVVFKSFGTALQDLAIARIAYRHACEHGFGTDLGELSTLKAFATSMASAARS